ncbi:MAG: hypothetical protein Q9162_001242 [Coniocarpon cinnabarinum]
MEPVMQCLATMGLADYRGTDLFGKLNLGYSPEQQAAANALEEEFLDLEGGDGPATPPPAQTALPAVPGQALGRRSQDGLGGPPTIDGQLAGGPQVRQTKASKSHTGPAVHVGD